MLQFYALNNLGVPKNVRKGAQQRRPKAPNKNEGMRCAFFLC
jgi:uncharacterized protein (UPF0147 family)